MNDSLNRTSCRRKKLFPLSRRAFHTALIGLLFTGAAPAATLWDSGTALPAQAFPTDRAAWKMVPTELFVFEEQPAKASSDPGYSGREYAFRGDAVVEAEQFTAIFSRARGTVELVTKSGSLGSVALPTASPMQRLAIVRNAGDEVILEVTYAAGESAQFGFSRGGVTELKPGGKARALRFTTPLAYGLMPGFLGDDLVYDPANFPTATTLAVPSEHCFVGLAPGGGRLFTLTWPKAQQRVQLALGGAAEQRGFTAVELRGEGSSFYLGTLAAPGLWHHEKLGGAFLEKDVALAWQRPFAAKWKTQFTEAGTRTSYAFRTGKGTIWRGVTGNYDYPVWFDGDAAFMRLGKKVPPKGDALIYCLEPRGTPGSVVTPVDFLTATLGRAQAETILDPAGRTLRTHHRRGGDGVHRACTCGCTEAIEAVFKAGKETSQREYISGAVDDMIFFVKCHVERIAEYERFAGDLLKHLKARAAALPAGEAYWSELQSIAQQIPQECDAQRENMKSLDHAAELAKQTLALTAKADPENVKTYAALLKAWRGMGGAQDSVLGLCHSLTRRLDQAAGYGCAELPALVAEAEAIRARCRQVLRHPDGYEIWADY